MVTTPLKFLLIDDSPFSLKFTRRLLLERHAGAAIDFVQTERDFDLAMQVFDYDFVISETNLSWHQGTDLFMELQDKVPFHGAEFLLFSAAFSKALKKQAKSIGIKACVVKQAQGEDLLKAIKLLQTRRPDHSLRGQLHRHRGQNRRRSSRSFRRPTPMSAVRSTD